MDRGAWLAAVHGVTKSRTQLNNFAFTFHFHALEKAMAISHTIRLLSLTGVYCEDEQSVEGKNLSHQTSLRNEMLFLASWHLQ